jgi:molybdopterin converting factor small subunit
MAAADKGYPPGEREHGIQVRVHLFEALRGRAGRARIDVLLEPGTTLEGLLQRLAVEVDEGFIDVLVRPPGEPNICVVILNGRTLRFPRDLQRELETGDELHLIPPIAGG